MKIDGTYRRILFVRVWKPCLRDRMIRLVGEPDALPPDLLGEELDGYLAGYRAATEAPWWDSAEAAFNSSSMHGELHASFVRGWEDGKAAVTPPDDPTA